MTRVVCLSALAAIMSDRPMEPMVGTSNAALATVSPHQGCGGKH